MKHLLLGLVVLVIGVAHAQEFDFRGAKVGMSLAEFQALPPIKGNLLRDGNATSCKPASDVESTKLGIIECMRAGDDPFDLKYGITMPSYKFVQDAGGTPRLYTVLIMSQRDNYADAFDELTTRWGKGTQSKTSATNGLGQQIPKQQTLWKKPSSEIRLEAPCGDVQYLCLMYSHNSLTAAVSSQRRNLSGSRF